MAGNNRFISASRADARTVRDALAAYVRNKRVHRSGRDRWGRWPAIPPHVGAHQ